MKIISYEQVESKIIEIREQQVIIDYDVGDLYGVETKRINEAVKNNPEKFPLGYMFKLEAQEKKDVVENFDRFKKLKHSTVNMKAFTERGLYMLATILKSPRATETTLAIIDTFAKVQEAGRIIRQLPATSENCPKHRELLEKTGSLISELIMQDNLESSEAEASIEVNLAVVKFKYTLKKKKS